MCMSKPDSPNPYESPKMESKGMSQTEFGEEVPFQGSWVMDYTGGFGMIHANPNWLTNCFLAGLCFLIPVVGPIVLIGYGYETAELLHRSNGRRHWDFNFNRFGDYLSRGVGPFLVSLVFGILQYVIIITLHIGMGVAAGAGVAGDGVVAGAGCLSAGFCSTQPVA